MSKLYISIGAIVLIWILRRNKEEYAIPVKEAKLTSDFGMRIHPITGEQKAHNGIDLAAKQGTPIYSVLEGIVSRVGFNETSGNFCVITSMFNGKPLTIGYAHMQDLPLVSLEQRVKQGMQIGKVGTTGRSTGPHLHLTVKMGGSAIDPLSLFPEIV